MANKVYVVHDICVNTEDWDLGDTDDIACICDSFESACNYIRKELLLILGEEAKKWAGSCLSFQEWLDDNGYKYDFEHLPSNDVLKTDEFVYSRYNQYQDEAIRKFYIDEVDLKHYD